MADENDFQPRPGRIRSTRSQRAKPFIAQALSAAQRAGGGVSRQGLLRSGRRSTFGRGRTASVRANHLLTGRSRLVTVKTRVVRHTTRSAPLGAHLGYLRREGVTRDGEKARLFGPETEDADPNAFAERCEKDRHHFRFIVSPEDAAEIGDLKTFTRELVTDMERDLGTGLDWVAVDHWNTDNPHVHLLIRGRADDGQDLVVSRDYISRGIRDRAAERITLELGPRTEQQIQSALEREVDAERWTSLDRALRDISDECGGVADLRPGPNAEDPDLRRLLLGRASKLERLGLAEPVGPACWAMKPGLDGTLRQLGIRGDIIKTMHQAMSRDGSEPDVSRFALHGEEPSDPVLGKLVQRGLDDELKGTAYVIVAGVDGHTHHLRFADLEFTGDAPAGAIVEARAYDDANGHRRLSLASRSDLSIADQVTAPGATWLDRQLLTKDPPLSGGGFGAEVREAMDARVDHLVEEGLAHRRGQNVLFERNLLATLRRREMEETAAKLAVKTGLAYQPAAEGEHVAGIYRQRVTLASGRFAMIDDGLGFQLVPWRPAIEKNLGREVRGVMAPGGGIDWDLGRKRGLGL